MRHLVVKMKLMPFYYEQVLNPARLFRGYTVMVLYRSLSLCTHVSAERAARNTKEASVLEHVMGAPVWLGRQDTHPGKSSSQPRQSAIWTK